MAHCIDVKYRLEDCRDSSGAGTEEGTVTVWYGIRIEDVVRRVAGEDRLHGVLHGDVIVVGSRHHSFSPEEIEPDVLGDLFEHQQQPMVVMLNAEGRIHEIVLRDRWAKVELAMDEEISPLYGILGHTLEITICDRPARVERYPLKVHVKHLYGSHGTRSVNLGPRGSDTTIQCLKEALYSGDQFPRPTQDFCLVCRGRLLREHRTLGDYRIPDDAIIYVSFFMGLKGVKHQGDDPLRYDDLSRTKEKFLADGDYIFDHILRWREERLQRMSIPVTGSLFLWPPGSTMREVKVTFTRDLSNHDFFARLQHWISHVENVETEEDNEESIPTLMLGSPAVSEDDDSSRRDGTADVKGTNNDEDAHGDDGDGDDIPPSFRCPITRCIMRDPVVAMDGNTYERTAIEEWIRRAKDDRRPLRSPLTGELLQPHVIANRTFRNSIEEFLQGRKEQSEKL